MSRRQYSTKLVYKYYRDWIQLYKENAVRDVTLQKYWITYKRIRELAPELHMDQLNRKAYQKIINEYAKTHEKQTTLDFHHQFKAAIIDALDDQLIEKDPTHRIIIKGCAPKPKKTKFLNLFELQLLLKHLDLGTEVSWDWFILLVAKTGLRFAEALALTPKDFDFEKQEIRVNKSWDYKSIKGKFQPTKNFSSNRNVMVDWHLMNQFQRLIKDKSVDEPIFVKIDKRIYNSTINHRLEKYCKDINVPVISIHGLRHTHASLLLYEGISVASVAKRLGHANITTTQETYIHIIKELENKDNDKVLHHLSKLI